MPASEPGTGMWLARTWAAACIMEKSKLHCLSQRFWQRPWSRRTHFSVHAAEQRRHWRACPTSTMCVTARRARGRNVPRGRLAKLLSAVARMTLSSVGESSASARTSCRPSRAEGQCSRAEIAC